MSDLIRKATVEKGHDPRNFVLFAFGGAAPVHASRYAAELGIRQVVIPLTASVHGATGLISSDVVYEYGKSDHVVVPVDAGAGQRKLFGTFRAGAQRFARGGLCRTAMSRYMRSVDMRYRYQVHELNVPFPAGTTAITERTWRASIRFSTTCTRKRSAKARGIAKQGKKF